MLCLSSDWRKLGFSTILVNKMDYTKLILFVNISSSKRDVISEEQLVNSAIISIINGTDDAYYWYEQVDNISMYPVPNGFEQIDFFDPRYAFGSDFDHNLPSKKREFYHYKYYFFLDGLLKWVLSNYNNLYPNIFKRDVHEAFKLISEQFGEGNLYEFFKNNKFKDSRKNISIAQILLFAMKEYMIKEFTEDPLWKIFKYFIDVWKFDVLNEFSEEYLMEFENVDTLYIKI